MTAASIIVIRPIAAKRSAADASVSFYQPLDDNWLYQLMLKPDAANIADETARQIKNVSFRGPAANYYNINMASIAPHPVKAGTNFISA